MKKAMAIGEPGDKAKVTQTIRVTMKETDDGKMLFTPSKFEFKKGKTVRFTVKNVGELDHEFILDEQKSQPRAQGRHGEVSGDGT